MSIGNRIAQFRKQAGLSQEALAEKLGVSRQSVSKWESGGVMPDIDKIIAMSDLFGVSTDDLLREPADTVDYQPQADLNEGRKLEEIFIYGNADTDPDDERFDAPDVPDTAEKLKKEKKKSRVVPAIAAILAIIIALTGIALPLKYGGIRQAWQAITGGLKIEKVKYTYVLVSGMGGWGDGVGINSSIPYWGADTGSLAEYLRGEGHEVCEATVGPFSSAWDRACELYAQLTGSRVDYGEAHSKKHNHSRYGRSYETARVPDWGKLRGGRRVKVHLIGHSFGGATVRLLTSLLAYGDTDEQNAGQKDISPLFEGGKADWVQSVTALAAPHNGSSLTEVLNTAGRITGLGSATELMASLVFSFAGFAKPLDETYDFMLDQFGVDGPLTFIKAYDIVTSSGNDNVSYDLSPDGAAELNKRIRLSDKTYYFSYPYSTTKKGSLLGLQVPVSSTLPVLMPTALAIGNYSGTTPGGIVIDDSWHENDGLVSVISARHPADDPFTDLPEDRRSLERGIWYVADTAPGDHGTVIGMQETSDETHGFFDRLFEMLDGLSR